VITVPKRYRQTDGQTDGQTTCNLITAVIKTLVASLALKYIQKNLASAYFEKCGD